MVTRWLPRLAIWGALASSASCSISVDDYPLEGSRYVVGEEAGSSGDGSLAGECGEPNVERSKGGSASANTDANADSAN
jgi:hypothetical protein